MEIVLRTDGLSKNYGAIRALDELTLEVGRKRYSATSGPTEPARPPRSGSCWA